MNSSRVSRFPGRVGHLVDIAAQDRRQVGVDHRGVAAPDQLHQRADLVADRHLGEADLAGDRRDPRLVVGEAKAVQQHDGHGPEAGVEGGLQAGAGGASSSGRSTAPSTLIRSSISTTRV
jgi:hypothetical protein